MIKNLYKINVVSMAKYCCLFNTVVDFSEGMIVIWAATLAQG